MNRRLKIILGILLSVGLVSLSSVYLPDGIDWNETFYPIGQAVLHGRSPYIVPSFRGAPWTVLLVLPFAWLPKRLGRAAFLFAGLTVFAYVARKLRASKFALAVFLLSPPVLHCLLHGNLDWMPLLGFVLPPPLGMFLIAIKPQMSTGVAVYWIIAAFKRGGWREVARLLAPVTLVTGLSFILFGFWPMRFEEPTTFWWNASLWPASIPIGLVFLTIAVKRDKIEPAIIASPFLSPYVLLHSWAGALVALSDDDAEMLAAVVGLWTVVLIRALEIYPVGSV